MNKKIQNAIKKYKDACNLLASIVNDKLFDGFRDWYCVGDEEYEHESDDLEEAASRYAKEEYSRKNPATLPNMCIGCYAPIINAFRNGAKWKEQHYDTINRMDAFEYGYLKAEKDNELTWEDLALIRLAFDATEDNINHGCLNINPMTKEYYEEVLKRFKAQKGE